MKNVTTSPTEGAVYAVFVEELKKYGAYQILKVEQESLCYIALDYLKEELPKEEELSSLEPYYKERFRYQHTMDMRNISNIRIPQEYIFIGICTPVTDKKCNSFSGDWEDGMEYVYEETWKESDSSQRKRYKKYINSGDHVTIGDKTFKKNYGGLTTYLNTAYEAAGEQFSIEQFPCATFVEIEGEAPGVIESIADATLIQTFRWKKHNMRILDFRNTYLRYLELDATGVNKIFLPKEIRRLELSGVINPELQIIGGLSENEIDVRFPMQESGLSNYGLKGVKRLWIKRIQELSVAEIKSCFPEINLLSVAGAPGFLNDIKVLAEFEGMRSLMISDLFGYTKEEITVLERMPQLKRLYLESIPKDVGMAVRKKWKGKLDTLEVRKLRANEWLEENMANPFRHWDGSEFVPSAAFKKASQQYKKTKDLLQKAAEKKDIVIAVEEYGKCFNRLNKRYDEFIETEEREDIFCVLELLYEEGLCKKELITLKECVEILDRFREEW